MFLCGLLFKIGIFTDLSWGSSFDSMIASDVKVKGPLSFEMVKIVWWDSSSKITRSS